MSKDKANERERTRSGGFASGVSSESAQLITDSKGNEYQRLEYTPYGELWIEKTSSEASAKYLPYKFTGKERDEGTGLYYFGARYLDAKYSRWLSTDPALTDYIPLAPLDDKARRHNENLPGMGGVFNTVNLHLYHYAGNNPVNYIDPDGRDIYSVTFTGAGAKLIIGGDVSIGFAWDDNCNVALVVQGGAGFGFEAKVKLPGLYFTRTKDININELDGIGNFRYSADVSLERISIDVGVGIAGVSFSSDGNEMYVSGGGIGTVGGGVNIIQAALYINLKKGARYLQNLNSEQKQHQAFSDPVLL